MKFGVIRAVILLGFAMLRLASMAQEAPSDALLVQLASDLKSLQRVTYAPLLIKPEVSTACVQAKKVVVTTYPLPAYAHVYVTTNALPAMRNPEMIFPFGAVILKQKFVALVPHFTATNSHAIWHAPTNQFSGPELYTGMLKREKGFNPDCGDWEFFTLSGDAKKVTSRGKLTSCMDCHQRFAVFDFVSTRYGAKP